MKKAIDMAGAAKKRTSRLSGIPTQLKKLDEQMGGLQRSDLIILAGRPGMGKTSLATNIAFNIANAYIKAKENNLPAEENEGGKIGRAACRERG